MAVEDCGITTLLSKWNKTEHLVQANGTILKVPWSSDTKDRLVMSSSSEHPHLVKTQEKKYSCDNKYTMFKVFSHVLTAAHENGDCSPFLILRRVSACLILQPLQTRECQLVLDEKVGLPRGKNRVTIPIGIGIVSHHLPGCYMILDSAFIHFLVSYFFSHFQFLYSSIWPTRARLPWDEISRGKFAATFLVCSNSTVALPLHYTLHII